MLQNAPLPRLGTEWEAIMAASSLCLGRAFESPLVYTPLCGDDKAVSWPALQDPVTRLGALAMRVR